MANLSSSEVMQQVTVWFRTIFEHPDRVYVWGFHPCQLFLDPKLYYDPKVGCNVGPREFGGDFDGCWVLTFSHFEEATRGFWAQHGTNQEARHYFGRLERPDIPYPHITMDENLLSRWITEVHAHLAVS